MAVAVCMNNTKCTKSWIDEFVIRQPAHRQCYQANPVGFPPPDPKISLFDDFFIDYTLTDIKAIRTWHLKIFFFGKNVNF